MGIPWNPYISWLNPPWNPNVSWCHAPHRLPWGHPRAPNTIGATSSTEAFSGPAPVWGRKTWKKHGKIMEKSWKVMMFIPSEKSLLNHMKSNESFKKMNGPFFLCGFFLQEFTKRKASRILPIRPPLSPARERVPGFPCVDVDVQRKPMTSYGYGSVQIAGTLNPSWRSPWHQHIYYFDGWIPIPY